MISHQIYESDERPPEYIQDLLVNFVYNYKKKIIWLNHESLKECQFIKLEHILLGDNQLFDKYGIDQSSIKYTRQYKWKIEDEEFVKFTCMRPGDWIRSLQYKYTDREMNIEILFHLECYHWHSYESHKSSLFLHLDTFPEGVDAINIEFDVICNKTRKYHHLLRSQWISNDNPYCGFQAFSAKELEKDKSIEWNIALKVLEITKIPDIGISIGMDRNESFSLNGDYQAMKTFCKSLMAKNRILSKQLDPKETDKDSLLQMTQSNVVDFI